MTKSLVQLICTFLILANSSFAQKSKMRELSNQVLCNVYNFEKADSLTIKFLKDSLPYLTRKRPDGQIVMPPIGIDAIRSVVTMKFQKHPFFDFNITEGILNFATVQSPGESRFATDAQLYLFFTTEQSADSAFNQLIKLYKSVSDKQDISDIDGQKVGKINEVGADRFSAKAFIKLSKDNSSSYKIYFTRWFKEN
jgi:hypothetical protein